MGRLAELSLADVGRAALRYRPVMATVAAIVAIAFFVPGRDSTDAADDIAAPGSNRSWATSTTVTSAPPRVGTAPAPVVALPSPPLLTGAGPSTSTPSAGAPRPTTPPAPPPAAGSPVTEPLRVRSSAWASQAAGTPAADFGVPDGTLPVGTRLGQVDKATFVRLTGSSTVLTLAEDPAGARATTGAPAVQACAVLAEDASWEPGEAMAFDDAPDWDPDACVAGIRAGDGSWSFDLAAVATATVEAGFALVPEADAPLDFQVAFRPA